MCILWILKTIKQSEEECLKNLTFQYFPGETKRNDINQSRILESASSAHSNQHKFPNNRQCRTGNSKIFNHFFLSRTFLGNQTPEKPIFQGNKTNWHSDTDNAEERTFTLPERREVRLLVQIWGLVWIDLCENKESEKLPKASGDSI